MNIEREHTRFNLGQANIECTPASLFAVLRRKPGMMGTMKNISSGGVQVISREKPAEPGSPVSVRLNIPTIDTPLLAKGQVKWTQFISSNNTYRTGIEFNEMNDESLSLLERNCEKIRCSVLT